MVKCKALFAVAAALYASFANAEETKATSVTEDLQATAAIDDLRATAVIENLQAPLAEDLQAISVVEEDIQALAGGRSNIIFIKAIKGTKFTPPQEHATQLQGFLLSFVGQLVGTDWTVEIGDFSQHKWMPVGTLCGTGFCAPGIRGILRRTDDGGSVCCDPRCNQCGGPGCGTGHTIPGLRCRDCCVRPILRADKECGTAPCVLPDNQWSETSIKFFPDTPAKFIELNTVKAGHMDFAEVKATNSPGRVCSDGTPGLEGAHGVCCDLSCGTCGGGGCAKRPGGSLCCNWGIKRAGKTCKETGHRAPCTLPHVDKDAGK